MTEKHHRKQNAITEISDYATAGIGGIEDYTMSHLPSGKSKKKNLGGLI